MTSPPAPACAPPAGTRAAIENRRGSTFLLCGRAASDPRYPRYPPPAGPALPGPRGRWRRSPARTDREPWRSPPLDRPAARARADRAAGAAPAARHRLARRTDHGGDADGGDLERPAHVLRQPAGRRRDRRRVAGVPDRADHDDRRLRRPRHRRGVGHRARPRRRARRPTRAAWPSTRSPSPSCCRSPAPRRPSSAARRSSAPWAAAASCSSRRPSSPACCSAAC